MSYQLRLKQVDVQVCDLCGEEITECTTKGEIGSVMGGVVESERGEKTPTAVRKRVYLRWPPRPAPPKCLTDYSGVKLREYDFHGECIVRLVEGNLFNRDAEGETNS